MKHLLPLFALIVLATACKKNETKTYAIGDEAFGGIVIQVDETKEHGLVVAKSDQVTYAMHKNWNDSKAIVEAYSEGGEGWRLPTQTELELIYSTKASLTGFDNRDYWSSTLGNGTAWSKYFGSTMGGFTSSPWKALSNCTLCSRGVKAF
jgi:hypothetical protein